MIRHVRMASVFVRMNLPGPQPLTPVGRDCDCGYPLVWYADRQVCAVYGDHPPNVPTRWAS